MSSRYRLCGLTLETDWPLKTPLVTGRSLPDLHFRVSEAAPGSGAWSPAAGMDPGSSAVEPGMVGSTEVVRFVGTGDAWFVSDREIVFHLTHPEHDFQVEVILLGTLLAYWLERSGVSALHGSGVAGDGWSAGILGPNGSGKTSLALDLMEAGLRFVTDDLLAVGIDDAAEVFPSFPQARLRPEEAEARLGSTEGLELAHPNYDKLRVPIPRERFSRNPARLAALYLVRPPGSGSGGLEPIEGHEVLFHLMLNTFARELVDTPAQRRSWLERLGSLITRVPVFSLPHNTEVGDRDLAQIVAEHAEELAQSKRSSRSDSGRVRGR